MSVKAFFNESVSLTKSLLKHSFWALGALFLFGLVLNLSIEETLAQMPPTQDDGRWQLQILMGLWDIFEGLATLLLLARATTAVRSLNSKYLLTNPLQKPFLVSFLAEYLRMTAQILLWGLLLLIPGFVRYCRLIFVPLIALFSREYRNDQVDALELSTQLSQGRFAMIALLLLATTGLQVAFEFLPHVWTALHPAPIRSFFSLASFLIAVWTYSFLFVVFEKAIETTEAS